MLRLPTSEGHKAARNEYHRVFDKTLESNYAAWNKYLSICVIFFVLLSASFSASNNFDFFVVITLKTLWNEPHKFSIFSHEIA